MPVGSTISKLEISIRFGSDLGYKWRRKSSVWPEKINMDRCDRPFIMGTIVRAPRQSMRKTVAGALIVSGRRDQQGLPGPLDYSLLILQYICEIRISRQP